MQASTPTHHQHLLAELTDMAMDIARTLHARITEPDAEADAPQDPTPLAAAFDRIARCARRTILLADHLATPRQDPAQTLATARRHILRAVEDKITRNDDPIEDPDALRRELRERLDGPDVAADLLTRPLPEIIKEIGDDMGLDRWPFAAPFPRRTPADIARLLDQAAGTPKQPGAASPWTHSSPRRLPNPSRAIPDNQLVQALLKTAPRKP